MDPFYSHYKELAEMYATRQNLDEKLVCAIIEHESSWEPWVVRYEPKWNYLYFYRENASRLLISEESEMRLQMFSWGLGQMMGSVFRELGYSDQITKLPSDVDTQLDYMCRKLKLLSQRQDIREESDIIASWNAGSPRKTPGGMYENQKYVDAVSQILRRLRSFTDA